MGKKTLRVAGQLMGLAGGLICLWALTALISGLNSSNWQVSELIHHYLAASGMIHPLHTIVDFYSHIKGIEYIICVVFFVAFPLFFRYLERRKKPVTPTVGSNKS